MSEFIQGGYNIQEHNHVEWSDARLHHEALTVAELRKVVHYVGERALQMDKREALVMQEQIWRYAETHPGNSGKQVEVWHE